MSKGKRTKDYERAGPELGKSRDWYRPVPPTLSKKDIMRKMIQDSKSKR